MKGWISPQVRCMHLFQTEQHVHATTCTDAVAWLKVSNPVHMPTKLLSHFNMGRWTSNVSMKETCHKLFNTLRSSKIIT